eukprot:COSAG06_NODE_1895_length_8122_cov_7.903278_6_plen_91_part_00
MLSHCNQRLPFSPPKPPFSPANDVQRAPRSAISICPAAEKKKARRGAKPAGARDALSLRIRRQSGLVLVRAEETVARPLRVFARAEGEAW